MKISLYTYTGSIIRKCTGYYVRKISFFNRMLCIYLTQFLFKQNANAVINGLICSYKITSQIDKSCGKRHFF